ncbi:MAG: 2-oxoglutarate dehydrogenase E1 component [Gemmatimonadetes bacterium]|nr:2-oxoglutarate dehydrogenase E1 component [Gemmatimonadota bacterium]
MNIGTNGFDTYNAGYAQEMLERWLRNPGSVDPSWARLFGGPSAEFIPSGVEGLGAGVEVPRYAVEEAPAMAAALPVAPARREIRALLAAAELVDAYRLNGHLAAQVDPLGSPPPGHPMLDPAYHGITSDELETVAASLLDRDVPGETLTDVLEWLKATYSGSIGYEYEHLEDPVRRDWLREQIETGAHKQPLGAEEKRKLLRRLSEVEGFEQFLHRAYLGQKRFSVEGTDMLVPMLELAIERAAAGGAREVVLGMAHRGRLNVLVHVLGVPYGRILAEFEGQAHGHAGTGDVKYHLGAEGTYTTAAGQRVSVVLAPNPSHLEFVNPVVEGITRARQSVRRATSLEREEHAVVPILIHGDAALSAQGVVAETLNLAELAGYRTGGTLHLIVNNQIGFTTDPREARSTGYASDLAKGFDIPIFHVNADDPEACLAVARLALAYRGQFHGDVVIDLIGYRRFGHNEGDEPAYTQPVLYQHIQAQPSVRARWAEALLTKGVVSREHVDTEWQRVYQRLVEAQDAVRRAGDAPAKNGNGDPAAAVAEPVVETAVPAEKLLAYDRELHSWPDGFTVHPKLVRALGRRSKLLPEGGPIDWGHAESLALAALLADGTAIRLTGQDTARGTFSQRHLVLHDASTGRKYIPLGNLREAAAPLEVHNSPLSEMGVLGFEYGYSIAVPDALVLWEAQFGDFVNAAQVMVDQFISAGGAKWAQHSRLVLLLPHGYEGQGPEHSSARLERFLQLAAEDNLRVANCSTPAQYFHLLRRQALSRELRPLVVLTPKSLLRHPRAASRLEELANGSFRPVLDDAAARDRTGEIRRLVLCTGKVYYDLLAGLEAAGDSAGALAIARVEQLYPFPQEELTALVQRYGALDELVWVQEEPQNMGAWRFVEPRLRAIAGERVGVGYIGRPERASPAEGYASRHEREQTRIVRAACTLPVRGHRAGADEKR